MSGALGGRVALITGASRGIGAAVARRFTKEGAHCILLGRNRAALEETDDAIRALGGAATLIPQNLEELDSLDQLGPALFQKFGRLDILVANAALLGTLSPIHQIEPKEWDQLLNVNLTANWRLIRTLDPLLRASPAGRAIFVTSGVTEKARPYWGTYAVSKTALEMLAGIYAAETAQTNLRVNIVDPGRVRTAMRAKAYPGEDPMTLPTPDNIADGFVHLASNACTKHGERIKL